MFGVSRHLRVQRTSFAFGPAVLPPCSPSFVNGAPNAWDTGPGIFLHPLIAPSLSFGLRSPNCPRGVVMRDCVETTCLNCMCFGACLVLTVIVLTFWNKGAILPSYGCCSSFILDSRDHLKYSLNVCKPRVFVLYNIVISGPISIMYKRILDSSHSY